MTNKKMLIIDGNSLVNRAFYALPPLTNREGMHTNGIYGFLTMLFKVQEEIVPDYITVAFDLKAPTFRHKKYTDYKAGRKKMPEELAEQIEPLKEILDALGIYRMELEGFEADDLIGTVAKIAENDGCHTYIVSGDKDVLQLASDKITLMITKKGISNIERYDPARIVADFEIPVERMIDLKGLMGDKSDNIPGIPGVGIKTATKLVKEFGSIENILNQQEAISNKKLQEKVSEYQEQLILSKKLATIETGVPIELLLEEMTPRSMKHSKLLELFRQYEFNTLLDKVLTDERSNSDGKEKELLSQITSLRSLEKISKQVEKGERLYFYSLSNNEHAPNNEAVAIGFMLDNKEASGWIHYKGDDEESLGMKKLIEKWLTEFNITKITHDLKKESSYLMNRGKEVGEPYFDIMLADYLINPSKSSYRLTDMAAQYEGLELEEPDEWLGKGKKKKQLQDIEESKMAELLSDTVHFIHRCYPTFKDKLKEEKLEELYYQVELPLTEVLASMEKEGIGVDPKYLEILRDKFDENIKQNKASIFESAGVEFNINSPKQLGEVLFEKLKLPPIKKTKTGFSTNAEVLEKLKEKHQVIPLILEYRQLSKIKSTYIDGLGAILNQEKKRIYSTFHQATTATGRISSSEPNLQNIPVKTETGRQLRKVFVARDGYQFIDADYSQIELRIMAHLSDDEGMLKAFQEESDIHTRTAAQIFNIPEKEVTSIMRSKAKAVNFGIIYGISDYGLATNLNITRNEAQSYIQEYFEQYPGVKKYVNEMIQEGAREGAVRTLMNRIRYIPEIHSKNFNQRSFGERLAMNTPIQGTAADIIKIAMVKVYKKLRENDYKAKIILQVHDELIIEAPDEEVEEVSNILKREMENTMTLKVPLKVDLSVAKNWYDAK
ncbi:DNA polymerase I [Tindallia californiensis]|uniref:DNA polymerase I n=1 Tax=Tindallia californiensis TaxID=159292 RepID=A0A1H3IVF7_9FIRM|nr:DNA polymerase I [Tindallia californiensis]SDY31753.1 DNA polymerase I [Tindallia californiensis]